MADGAIERELAHLDVPVTELMPGKPVQGAGVIVESVGSERLSHLTDCSRQTRSYPAVDQSKIPRREPALPIAAEVTWSSEIHLHEPRRVPQLVDEVLISG